MAKRASVPEGKALFFRPPTTEPEREEEEEPAVTTPPPKAVPSAPASPRAPSRQSAIFLQEKHLDWLEDRCRDARRNGGRAIRKAAIIRALLDVAMESPIDLTGLQREEDLVRRLRQGLRG